MTLNFSINARRIAVILAVIALYLAVQSIAGRYVEEHSAEQSINVITNLVLVLNINRESSIPTWYSSSLLLTCAGVLAVIALGKRASGGPFVRHWAGLAVIFLYLSIDEAAAIHEKFTIPLEATFDTGGYLTFAWVIVGAPLALLFALAYLKFLFHLPPFIRNRVALAGVLYVGGALVIESISANQWYWGGGTSLLYSAIGTVEELFEMWGTILFLYALLSFVQQIEFTLNFQPQTATAPGADGQNTLPAPTVASTRMGQ